MGAPRKDRRRKACPEVWSPARGRRARFSGGHDTCVPGSGPRSEVHFRTGHARDFELVPTELDIGVELFVQERLQADDLPCLPEQQIAVTEKRLRAILL